MSVRAVSDEFLARRVKRGDELAFAELARRYRPLIGAATRQVPPGLEAEDARQAALIGLLEACRESDGVRRFAGIARLRVRWRVGAARRAATAQRSRVLTEAGRGRDEGAEGFVQLAATPATDPACVVELREELRERLRERAEDAGRRAERERRRAVAPRGDLRRRYSEQQIHRAISMIVQGATVAAAAAAVGARYSAVHTWIKNPRIGAPAAAELARRRERAPGGDPNRRFTDEQIQRAVSMVADGSTITAAATAVGASHPTILRWLRNAA